jgi:hypothetical protein
MKRGVGKALLPWLKAAGANLARSAKVTVSSSHESGKYKASMINDGNADPTNNDLRWVSDANPPHWVELAWKEPRTISATRIVSGFVAGDGLSAALADFVLQYRDGSAWKDIPGTKTSGNTINDLGLRFKPVTTSRVRLVVTAALGGLARIWELEAYNPPASAK